MMEVGSISQVIERVERMGGEAVGVLSERECVRRFGAFMERLRNLLEQVEDSYSDELPAAVGTALRGIENDLQLAEETLSLYRPKSRFFVLTHCHGLNKTMEDLTQGLGKWIALAGILEDRELKMKADELSVDMQRVKYQVAEAEQRSLEALEKQERLDRVVAGSLWRDIARLIGVEPQMNSAVLQEQVQLLRKEVRDLKKDSELQKMKNILKLFDHVTEEPQLTRMYSYKETVEEEPPFESFICPLTKQIMKDPVMVQSELTYERAAIQKWFNACNERGRSITCPVTGTVLSSSELKNNVTLRDTIEEWFKRNANSRIHQAMTLLDDGIPPLEKVEEALDNILKVAEDGPLTPHKLARKSRFTSPLLDLWKRKVPDGSQVRTKALIILQRIAADDEDTQDALIKAGVLKTAVRALHSNLVSETESALKLLLVISKEAEHSKLIGKEKGAIIHLLGIASNSDGNSSLSMLAEKTLQNLEQVDFNVWEMAESGRLEPLLSRFHNGSEGDRVEIAKYLGERLYVASQKEHVARKVGKSLIQMLSGNTTSKEASMRALLNLSSLQDNVLILVKAGILVPVVDIMFSVPTSSNALRGTLKEEAAKTVAQIVSVPGSWEAAGINENGDSMQSEFFVHGVLDRLSSVGPDWNKKLLQILVGVSSSPQAAESVAKHVVSGNGMRILIALAQENAAVRVSILHLFQVLSLIAGRAVGEALVQGNYVHRLKDIMKGKISEESLHAAAILASIPLTESDVVNVLGLDTMNWCLSTLEALRSGQHGSGRLNTAMMESLLGVLLQFARSWNRDVLDAMKQNKLMQVFKEFLQLHLTTIKQKAAAGLGLLSQRGLQTQAGRNPSGMSEQETIGLFCCFTRPSVKSSELCPLHKRKCNVNANFCLHEAGVVGLLVELLEEEEDIKVQVTVVDALSTLVMNSSQVESGVQELAKARGIEVVMRWFQRLRGSSSSEAQEKGVYLVERILRVEQHAIRWSLDQGLVKALVEVFKHGTVTARKNAEAALAHTQQLSVVSGGTGGYSNGSRGTR